MTIKWSSDDVQNNLDEFMDSVAEKGAHVVTIDGNDAMVAVPIEFYKEHFANDQDLKALQPDDLKPKKE